MKRYTLFLVLILFCCVSTQIHAQRFGRTETKTLTYEELYDDPYDINKLFIHLQPIYGELFTTNVTAGFGLQAQYYHQDVFDVMVHARTAYHSTFDMQRDASFKNQIENSDNPILNEPKAFGYMEAVVTYHVVDREEDVESKFVLYSKRTQGDKWAATVPDHTVIPTKMRRIYGVRVGALHYQTAFNVNRILENQDVALEDEFGDAIDPNLSVYNDYNASGFILGGSISLIKNVAVQPDSKYGTLVNDLIFTAYFDIIATPFVTVSDIYEQIDNGERLYTGDQINTSILGARAGIEGKFNRALAWGYGAEVGYRPGLQGSGFYMTAKISFPVFSTKLDNRVESFGK
ncbi:MAG TPA: hypothetical protein DDY13_03595 [Cytophagales bacterium]|nr:hypothetical protein [Cytophagales bacterium]